MTIIRCFHCRTEVNNDNGSDNDVIIGICFICWKLEKDAEWYQKNGMEKIAEKMKIVLELRKVTVETEIKKVRIKNVAIIQGMR